MIRIDLPVQLLIVGMKPPSVILQSIVWPVRHGRKVNPEVLDRQLLRPEIDDGEVAEGTTLLLQGCFIESGARNVEHQRCVYPNEIASVTGR